MADLKTVYKMVAVAAAFLVLAPAFAHHSYAMFDFNKRSTVVGVVAKLEWMNPHTYVWIYVPNKAVETGYDLYTFENGPITLMTRLGWSKSTFTTGERITVEYAPLKDGRNGGHFVKAISADGRVINGDDGLPKTGP
jgi:hypothetical protein